jgi:uncharacterized membrane protein YcaP (DUF421 family)
MFFSSWQNLARIAILGSLAYLVLLASLRLTGKRTLAALNAIDLVVVVAIGNILAMVMLSGSAVAFMDAVAAVLVLSVLEVALDWATSRSHATRALIEGRPRIVYYQGRYLREAMRRERLTVDEIRAAARSSGHGSMDDVTAVVLERSGKLSVLARGSTERSTHERSTLEGVEGYEDARAAEREDDGSDPRG